MSRQLRIYQFSMTLALLVLRPVSARADVCSISATTGLPTQADNICTYVGSGNGDGGPAINAIIDPRDVEIGRAHV